MEKGDKIQLISKHNTIPRWDCHRDMGKVGDIFTVKSVEDYAGKNCKVKIVEDCYTYHIKDLKIIEIKEEKTKMYLIKELKTYAEIQQEGRDLHNALSVKTYVKNLKDQKVKIYVCREVNAPNTAFVAFAVFPKGYSASDTHMFEKWGDKYINIRANHNAKPEMKVQNFCKAWLYGQGLIEVPPTTTKPVMTINNGTVKVVDVYDVIEFYDLVRDLAGALIQGKRLDGYTMKELGYTVTMHRR